jgi:hypothetical protein
MKKAIFFFVCFFTANIATAQVFSGMGIGSQKTINTQLGFLYKGINTQLTAGCMVSYQNTNRPDIPYINIGYRVKLGDEIKITLTPAFGIARLSYGNPFKVLKTDHNGVEVININSNKLMYSLELGKEAGIGRFYVSCTKIGSSVFYEAGIKAFMRDFEQVGFDPGNW